jgi:hypothetical protein
MAAGRSACYLGAVEPEVAEPATGGVALEVCRRSSSHESASRPLEGSTHRFPLRTSSGNRMALFLRIRKASPPIAMWESQLSLELRGATTVWYLFLHQAADMMVFAPRDSPDYMRSHRFSAACQSLALGAMEWVVAPGAEGLERHQSTT